MTPSSEKESIIKSHGDQKFDFEELLSLLPGAICVCDNTGKLLFSNPAASSLLGFALLNNEQLFHGFEIISDDSKTLFEIINCVLSECIDKRQQIALRNTDGSVIKLTLTIKPLSSSQPDQQLVLILIEATEKASNAESTADTESNDMYHKMVEEVKDYAILMLDSDGKILNWNSGAENIKGYTSSEIIGKNFRQFYLKEDREMKLPEMLMNEAVINGRAVHEGWRVRKNGEKFWAAVTITALHDNQNNVIGYSKVTRDLTERKIAEDQMKIAALDIELRNNQLEQYAHAASHDLQEPLRKILVFSSIIDENRNESKIVMDNLEKIKKAAQRMLLLINDVLRYSNLSHEISLWERVDLKDVLSLIKEDFELAINEKNVKIIDNGLCVVSAIPIQMQQLLSNLFSNSIKFSSDEPVIEIICSDVISEDYETNIFLDKTLAYVKLIFRDNGIGFDPQYKDRIFNMFERLRNNKEKGTGIGLAMCKRIVENHKGLILSDSSVGVGTTFTIFLPAYEGN